MAASWIKEVPAESVQDGVHYFLAKRTGSGGNFVSYFFYAENRAGKRMMSEKPGIAMRIEGSDELRAVLRGTPNHVCIAIPNDTDKRWRARRC